MKRIVNLIEVHNFLRRYLIEEIMAVFYVCFLFFLFGRLKTKESAKLFSHLRGNKEKKI